MYSSETGQKVGALGSDPRQGAHTEHTERAQREHIERAQYNSETGQEAQGSNHGQEVGALGSDQRQGAYDIDHGPRQTSLGAWAVVYLGSCPSTAWYRDL